MTKKWAERKNIKEKLEAAWREGHDDERQPKEKRGKGLDPEYKSLGTKDQIDSSRWQNKSGTYSKHKEEGQARDLDTLIRQQQRCDIRRITPTCHSNRNLVRCRRINSLRLSANNSWTTSACPSTHAEIIGYWSWTEGSIRSSVNNNFTREPCLTAQHKTNANEVYFFGVFGLPFQKLCHCFIQSVFVSPFHHSSRIIRVRAITKSSNGEADEDDVDEDSDEDEES
jgi:hypothetical protein